MSHALSTSDGFSAGTSGKYYGQNSNFSVMTSNPNGNQSNSNKSSKEFGPPTPGTMEPSATLPTGPSTAVPPGVGYLRSTVRVRPSSVIAGEHPSSALAILQDCLEAQKTHSCSFEVRMEEAASERRQKLLRLQSLRQQQARREALHAQDTEGIQATAEMLEEVVVAVRERQTSLSPNGYQAFVFMNQDVYEGNWKNARMHGKGVLRRAVTKDMYEGQWFLGQRSGQGMHHSSAFHTFYSGSWLENKRHGRGELLEPEGLYSGEFHDNNINGYGEYVYHDGHVYKGEWVCGLYEGVGTYIHPSGTKYEGGWRAGYEHGRGTCHFFNGDCYNGEWRFGLPHGYGTYTSPAFQYEGDWRYGTVQGKGVCCFADGSRYDGEWMNGKFHGLGSFSSPERRITYMGEFKNGKRDGRGEYNGQFIYYNGDWKNDMKHGVGTAKIRECGYYHGSWKNDFPEGRGTYRLWDEEMVWFQDGLCVRIEEMYRFRIVGVKVGLDAKTRLESASTEKEHEKNNNHVDTSIEMNAEEERMQRSALLPIMLESTSISTPSPHNATITTSGMKVSESNTNRSPNPLADSMDNKRK